MNYRYTILIMAKGMKFHTTKRTIFISLVSLIVLTFFVLFFSLSITFFSIDEPLILSSIIKLENELSIQIEVDSIETNMFTRVALNGVSFQDNNEEMIATFDSIHVETPWYRLLPRYIFNQPIPVTLSNGVFTINSSHQDIVDQLSNSTDVDGMLPFSIEALLNNTSIEYTGDNESITAVVPSMKLIVKSGEIREFNAFVSMSEYSSKDLSFSIEGLVADATVDTQRSLTLSLSTESVYAKSDSLGVNTSLDFSSLSYSGNITSMMGRVEGSLINLDVAYRDNALPFHYMSDYIEINGTHNHITIEKGTINSSPYTIEQSNYSLEGNLLTLQYQQMDDVFSLTLNNESLLKISDEPFVSMDSLKGELSLHTDNDSIRIEGNSITLLSSAILENFIESSLIEELIVEDPYLLVSKRGNEEQYIYETSGKVRGKTSFIAQQTVDFDFFSDGSIDNSFTIENIQVSLVNLKSNLLSPTYSVNALYNKNLLFPLELTIKDQNNLSISLKRDITNKENQLLFKSSNTFLYPYKDLIYLFAPVIPPSITKETTLIGQLSVELDDAIQKGRVNASIAFQEIAIGDNTINAASTILASIDEKTLLVDLATITTTGVRVSYSGEINRLTWLPKGVLEVTDVTKGTSLAAVDFRLLENQEVGYTLTTSLISSLKIEGLARYASSFTFIETNGIFDIFNDSIPFKSSFNNRLGIIDTSLPGLSLVIDLLSIPGHLDIAIHTDSFKIPLPLSSFINSKPYLNGLIEADYSLSDNQFAIKSENIEIRDISILAIDRGVLTTSIAVNNSQLFLHNLTFTDNVGTLSGSIDVKKTSLLSLLSREFNNFSFKAILREDEKEKVDFRLVPDSDNSNSSIATLFINDFPLERISSSYKDLFASASVAGVTDFAQIMDVEGRVEVNQDSANPIDGSLYFSINPQGISLYDGFLEKGNFSAKKFNATLLFSGQLEATADFLHKDAFVWRENNTTTSLAVEVPIEKSDNFFDFLHIVPEAIKNWDNIILSHSNTKFLGLINMKDGSHLISHEGNILSVKPFGRGSINATYNLSTNFLDIQANEDFPFPLTGKGIFSSSYISMDLPYAVLDLTYLNALFGEPVINFEKGLFEGNVLIEGPLSNPQYYGTMSSNALTLSLYWTGDQKLSLINPVVTLGENTFNLPYTRAVVNKKDGTDSEGIFKFETLFENWNISNYQLDAIIDKGTLSLAIPVPQIPLYIEAEASGSFGLIGTLAEEKIYGDITIPSGKIGFNIPELPIWFLPKARTSVEFDFTSGKNITFVYPNDDSPIVSATVADNQKLSLDIFSPSMVTTLQGDIALRSGEIYYIQENFYITEGSLVFPKGQVGNIEAAEPRLNLRARLRKFDLDGNRIDIFLILQNDSISSINPRFDSFPLRSNNEILQILGQNLLNTNFAENPDGGFQSVLSAAGAATDVISRLGLIQGGGITFGFSSIIRQSLGLDVFSIRSNLLQNILIEAIPGMSSDVRISPISRYLDNTTLYIGKYLLDELYLQGLLTFRRDFTGKRSSFLAEDLAIDTELSVEWLTDLATFSFFTQPEELSIFNLFDTMGFSITKNFEF